MTVDARTITCAAAGEFARATDVISFPSGTSIEFELSPEGGLIFALANNVADDSWGSAANVFIHAYSNSGLFYYGMQYGVNAGSVSYVNRVRCRFRRLNDDLLFESTDTYLSTWTTHYTRSGVLAGIPTVRVKAVAAVGAASLRAWCNPARVV